MQIGSSSQKKNWLKEATKGLNKRKKSFGELQAIAHVNIMRIQTNTSWMENPQTFSKIKNRHKKVFDLKAMRMLQELIMEENVGLKKH